MALTADERAELDRTTRQFLDRVSGPEQVRETIEDRGDPDEGCAFWKLLVDMGWTGIHVPGEQGGAGAGYEGLGVILHEMGRHLATSPYLASSVLATEALLHAPNREAAAPFLRGLAEGELRGAVRMPEQPLVLDAAGADLLITVLDSGEVVVIEDFTCRPVPTVDRTRRLFEVEFGNPPVAVLAAAGATARSLMERVAAVGAIAAAADAAGAAERITELTTDYAKNRFQFGKPIGSFQAVKHHCADMAIAVEASRGAVRAAFAALDDPAQDAVLAADITASYCGPACSRVCGLAIQVHGGIGFTWEHDAHLFLKRAKLDESLFGTPLWHRKRLAGTVFPTISVRWAGRIQVP